MAARHQLGIDLAQDMTAEAGVMRVALAQRARHAR
jgi:hypothetical protein